MTLAQQRAAAEERAHALLRSIVPSTDQRWRVHRNRWGHIIRRELTHLEFTGESCVYDYRIHFTATSENIDQIMRSTGRRVHGVCGGPYAYNDYLLVDGYRRTYPEIDNRLYGPAVEQANAERGSVLHLPDSDIWLGQYLALKYDEDAFFERAVVF